MNNRTAPILTAEKQIDIRFSEVDSMQIAWHGAYALYFEDAREAFGAKYGLGYLDIFRAGFYAPLVDLRFAFKSPLIYGDRASVTITYIPCPSAKIRFEYTLYNITRDRLAATGESTQVFLDKDYQLVIYNPDFYTAWKLKNGIQ